MKVKIRKSRLWVPAIGIVLTYGFLHNFCIVPFTGLPNVDANNLILAFSIVIGIGSARDIALKKFDYLEEVLKADEQKKLLRNKIWIPTIGWCLVGGFAVNICIAPYFGSIEIVDWSELQATLSLLLTISGVRDYGLFYKTSKKKPE